MPRMNPSTSQQVNQIMASLENIVNSARNEGREEALAEVRSLVGGVAHGLPRAAAAKSPVKMTKSGRPRKNPWANMTAEQREERVRKMLAGRGLTPAQQ